MNAKTISSFIHGFSQTLLITLSLFCSQNSASQEELTPTGTRQAAIRWKMLVEPTRRMSNAEALARKQLSVAGVEIRITEDNVTAEAQGTMEQMRAALFDLAMPWIDFLGGPVELTLYMPVSGVPVRLDLEARNTTGYRWELAPERDSLYLQIGEATFAQRGLGMGAPAIQTIHLKSRGEGPTAVRLRYQRPFEPNAPAQARLSVWLPTAANLDLTDPTGTELPASIEGPPVTQPGENQPYAQLDLKQTLPASFDWRTQGIIPPIRDQGACGSCWAFGTVGIMESAVKKAMGPLSDLSEQFLISCNNDGWSCNGGLTANKYHHNILARNQTATGAVLEAEKPYAATNGTCAASLNHPYRLSTWAFVTGSEWTMPTVAQIKAAIYSYGPVTAGVCVDNGWYTYHSGVYKPTSNVCGGYTNHQIDLIGWNDATLSWILRNSWGSSWGETGYMRIAWDTNGTSSRVGEGTSWVIYTPPAATVPTLYRPIGSTYTVKPTYSWSRLGTATTYKLQVYDVTAGNYPVNISIPSSYCSTATNRCSYTAAALLANGRSYQWRAAAVSGAYSSWLPFKALSGFNAQFNGSSSGWVPRPGGTWAVTGAVYYTNGISNKWSSASFNSLFSNFTYTVKMKRTEAAAPFGSGWATGLLVRGSPTSFSPTDNSWNAAYHFLYSQRGFFSIWKSTGGIQIPLEDWTTTTAIVRNNWNTLKVIADGTRLLFYINNVLVWSGADGSFASGQVGVEMYRNTAADQLQVDWATLGMSELYKALGTVEENQVEIPASLGIPNRMQRSP